MTWEFSSALDAASRAALSSGKPVVYVCPPTAWAVTPLLDHLTRTETGILQVLALVPGLSEGLELADVLGTRPHLRPVYRCTSLARAARRLAAGGVRTLVANTRDALELVRRSQLSPELLRYVALVWPEAQLDPDGEAAMDTLLSECRGAARLFVTADETHLVDLLERHAHRAPMYVVSRPPETPVAELRYAVVPHERVVWGVGTVLDVLNPGTALVWDPSPRATQRWVAYEDDPLVHVVTDPATEPVDLAIAAELPTSEALAALRGVGRQVVALVRPHQAAYLQRLAHRLTVVRLPSEVDRARDRGFDLRRAVRDQLEEAADAAELLTLAPLFDEYDPALVAAAALRMARLSTAGPPPPAPEAIHWVKVRLDAGRRDRVRTADIVGALLNAVGVARQEVGRVDVRERFTLVDVRADVAERAVNGLDGLLLRGRRVRAHLDRR